MQFNEFGGRVKVFDRGRNSLFYIHALRIPEKRSATENDNRSHFILSINLNCRDSHGAANFVDHMATIAGFASISSGGMNLNSLQ